MNDKPIGETGKGTAACLWSLFWRTCVLFPLAAIIGIVALVAVVAFTAFPPMLAIVWVLEGKLVWAAVAFAVWTAWLRYGGKVRRTVFEGFEHGSL